MVCCHNLPTRCRGTNRNHSKTTKPVKKGCFFIYLSRPLMRSCYVKKRLFVVARIVIGGFMCFAAIAVVVRCSLKAKLKLV